jgi:GrpB-like predicted nucleotidyltransferase (UPF0157 family)
MSDEIALTHYDPAWPDQYQQELERVSAVLPIGVIHRTEHIGSTAVPGMLAKPIVDILLGPWPKPGAGVRGSASASIALRPDHLPVKAHLKKTW